MVNAQIGDLVLLSQCTGSVVTSGWLSKPTYLFDKLSSRASVLGGISLTLVALVNPLPCCPACGICNQHLQQGWLSEYGSGAVGGEVDGKNQIMNWCE